MRSENGVTMEALILYVIGFLIISSIISSITLFFYNNHSLIDAETYSAVEFDKINMYLVKESEEENNRVETIEYDENSQETENSNKMVNYIEFTNRG